MDHAASDWRWRSAPFRVVKAARVVAGVMVVAAEVVRVALASTSSSSTATGFNSTTAKTIDLRERRTRIPLARVAWEETPATPTLGWVERVGLESAHRSDRRPKRPAMRGGAR